MLDTKKKTVFSLGTLLFIFSGVLVNVLNYSVSIMVSWRLSVDMYGELNALFSLLFLLAIPTIIIQTFVSNLIAEQAGLEASTTSLETRAFTLAGIVSVGFVGILLLFLPLFSGFLHSSQSHIASILFSLFLSFPLSVARGILQGKKDFSRLSASLAIEALVKFGIVAVGVFVLSFSLDAVLVAINVGTLMGLVFAYRPGWFSWDNNFLSEFRIGKDGRYFFHLFFGLSGIILFTNADVVLVRHFIPEVSGMYAALSRLGQVLLMGTNIVVSIFLPHYIGNYSKQQSTKYVFFSSIFLVLFAGSVLIGLYYFFAPGLMNMLFGHKYLEGADLLWYFGLAYLFVSLSTVIGNYFLALRKYWINFGIGAIVPVYFSLVAFSHATLEDFVFSFFTASFLLLVISCAFLLVFRYNKDLQKNSLTP